MNEISFPSWLTPELVISIVTLVATISGLIIAYLAYRKLKPGLHVQVTRCMHSVRYTSPTKESARAREVAGTELTAEFAIRNAGERTSIYDVGIRCKSTGQLYQTTEKVQWIRAVTVKKGDTITYSHQFYIPRRGFFETSFECTFFLYHTYGKKKVKAESNFQGAE